MGINTLNLVHNQRILMKRMEENAKEVQADVAQIKSSPLSTVPGLGAAAIESLRSAGIVTVAQLVSADNSVLKKALNPVTLKQVNSYIKSNADKGADAVATGGEAGRAQ